MTANLISLHTYLKQPLDPRSRVRESAEHFISNNKDLDNKDYQATVFSAKLASRSKNRENIYIYVQYIYTPFAVHYQKIYYH